MALKMDIGKGFAGVTLCWLYHEVKKRSREAFLNTHPNYIAARKIQALVRGYQVRSNIEKWNRNATIIQKNWRGFYARLTHLQFLKDLYIERMQQYYYLCATKIQSLWRGFYSRMHIHDHYKMKIHQREAAKELVVCIAHRLHYLLRTQHIPGVYSIRNSNCLSKVERLLASLKFKDYNHNVRKLRDEQLERIRCALDENKRKMKGSEKIPYGQTRCDHMKYKCMDQIMHKYRTHASQTELSLGIIKTKCNQTKKPITYTQQQHLQQNRYHQQPQQQTNSKSCNCYDNNATYNKNKNICADVVGSMTKWGIIQDERNFIVSPSIVKNTDCIEGFVGDVNMIWQGY